MFVVDVCGLTENAGHEIEGRLKMDCIYNTVCNSF